MKRSIVFLVAALIFSGASEAAASKPITAGVTKECVGNLETYDKKLIQAGVSYKLHYEVSGSTARVQFAGREFDAEAVKGKSWKGLWIKKMDGSSPIGYIPQEGGMYFSYIPEEGGIIKFQFEPQKWFSGNC